MSSKPHADRLARSLENTGLFEPVRTSFKPDQIIVIGRVHKPHLKNWVRLVERLELAMENASHSPFTWLSHFCQRYFLKDMPEGARKLVYAWNISIQSKNMSDSLDAIIRVIRGEEVERVVPGEIKEMPLPGASGPRNMGNERGKGAFLMESTNPKSTFRHPASRG